MKWLKQAGVFALALGLLTPLDVSAKTSSVESPDYETTLLIEADSKKDLPDDGEVLGSYGDMYLMGFDSEVEAKDVEGASENVTFSVMDWKSKGKPDKKKSAFKSTDVPVDNEKAFTNLKKELKGLPKKKNKDFVIALIDTGVPKDADVIDTVSMFDDNGLDKHGHGSAMLKAIRKEDKDAKVLSIKALDDHGNGDAASIYAAIQYAIKRNVSVINLSLSGQATEGNYAIEKAIADAVGADITVVGAAGNDGKDAKDYLPGGLDVVWTIGACDKDGKRQPFSNYGEKVNYYMEADSTSVACALFSGRLSRFEGDMDRAAEGLVTEVDKVENTEEEGKDADKGEDTGKDVKKDGFYSAAFDDFRNITSCYTCHSQCHYALWNSQIKVSKMNFHDKRGNIFMKPFTIGEYSDEDIDDVSGTYVYGVSQQPAGSHKMRVDSNTYWSFMLDIPDALVNLDNHKLYTLRLKIDNIYLRNQQPITAFSILKLSDNVLPSFASQRYYNDALVNPQYSVGTDFDIYYYIIDPSSGNQISDNILLGFSDIDQKAPNSAPTNYPDEQIALTGYYGDVHYGSDSIGSYLNTLTKDGETIYSAVKTCDGEESKKAGIGIVMPSGGHVRWRGTNCVTGCGYSLYEFITAKTFIEHMDTNGHYTISSGCVDTSIFLKNDAPNPPYEVYSSSYTEPGENAAIYGNFTQTMNHYVKTENITHTIQVPRKQYTYLFDGNKPQNATHSPENIPDKIQKYAELPCGSLNKTPTLCGYKFTGWKDANGNWVHGNGVIWDSNKQMLSNETFYAQWEPIKYHVVYDANGGTNFNHESGEFTQNKTAGSMERSTFSYDVAGTLRVNAFTREGYTFTGWNTAQNGSGLSYKDGYDNVLNWSDTNDAVITLYAQWKKTFGTETLKVISEETGNPVSGVTVHLYQNGQDTGIERTTNAGGKVTVNDLHWYPYEWRCISVPNGYRTVSSVPFTIYPNCNTNGTLCGHTSGGRPTDGYASLDVKNERILYMKHVSLQLDSQVSEIIKGEAPPSFFYHVEGFDVAGVKHAYDVMVPIDILSGSNTVPDMFAGDYTITQKPISRYVPGNAQNIADCSVTGINGTAELSDVADGTKGEIRFPYTIRQVGGFGSMDDITNALKK